MSLRAKYYLINIDKILIMDITNLPIFAGVDDASQQGDRVLVEILIREETEEATDEVRGGHKLLAIDLLWGVLRRERGDKVIKSRV